MLMNAKNGISSWELHRALGVTQKSAWSMLRRIRLAAQNKAFNILADEVEVGIDHAEAYVKGNVHTNGLENFWGL